MSMNDKDKQPEAALERLFAAARAEAPAPSPELMARVLAAAELEQAQMIRVRQAVPEPRAGFWAHVRQGLGGYPALAGLAAAGLAGVWIGLALPEGLPGGTGVDYVVDVTPGLSFESGGDF